MIYLLYVLALVALGAVLLISYTTGLRRGARMGATAVDNAIAHVAPDLYPELAQRMNAHLHDPESFHAQHGTGLAQGTPGDNQAN